MKSFIRTSVLATLASVALMGVAQAQSLRAIQEKGAQVTGRTTATNLRLEGTRASSGSFGLTQAVASASLEVNSPGIIPAVVDVPYKGSLRAVADGIGKQSVLIDTAFIKADSVRTSLTASATAAVASFGSEFNGGVLGVDYKTNGMKLTAIQGKTATTAGDFKFNNVGIGGGHGNSFGTNVGGATAVDSTRINIGGF